MIGTTLCSRLLAEGSEVFCLDNLQTGSKWNIRDMLDNELFHFLEKDITNPLDLDVDEIYHLACPASPKHYQEDPVRTARTNFQGALTVLELARRKQAKVLFTSTSEVYGEPLQHPQKEEYRGNVNPIGIRACYDEGKRIAETLFFDYHRKYGVDIRVARIFNTYGPYLDPRDGRVISNFIISALNHDNLVIYGDGNQTRSFCYVDDTVEALLRFMRKDKICGPVNIGNPHEITIRELAETIIRLTQCGTEIRHIAKPEDDPTRRCPDISLAEKELDWHPAVSLDEGLMKTIQYFRMRLAEDQMPQLPHYDTGLLMGVFDLFHIGHMRLIDRAKERCTYLRVAVLDDALVEQFKGHPPTIPLEDRMEILRGIRNIDEVVSISDTPSRLKEWERRPFDCFFSGDDYRGDQYWEWEKTELKKLGADLVFFPYTAEESSTQIRNRIIINNEN